MNLLASFDAQSFLQSDECGLMVFLLVAGFVLTVLILTTQWRRVRVAETEGAIKMRMIEKGYTADEIERVVAARPARPFLRHQCRPRPAYDPSGYAS